ncbi:MAG: glucose dehydrogenase, partial [Anaerolineae bacterium]|nr:glucose dehydrogenase [Anaerolineae bacterium]
MSRLLVGIAIFLLTLSTAAAQDITPPDGNQYALVEVAEGFERPLFITGANDGSGRLFIMEQGGTIFVSIDGVIQDTPFLDARALVST